MLRWQEMSERELAERKRVEAELRRSKEELASFIENAAIGLHSAGPDGIIKWANQAELELLGYRQDEYVGHHVSEFHLDKEVSDAMFARLNRGEKIHEQAARLRCKNGSFKHVLIDSNVLWEEGRFVHTQCFTRDVTAHRRSEAISRHMAAIIESSDDAIVSKDLNGIVTSWNQGAQQLFGYLPEEIIGKPILLIIPPDRHSEESRILESIRRGEPMAHFETVRQRKDGSLINISLTVSPIKDAKGRIIGVSKIARDISERQRAERDLRAVREQLAKANEDLERRVEQRTASLKEATDQMEEFSYTVSHDLRTPLRAMAIYSTALMEDYSSNLPPEALHHLKRIADNALLLDKMILDVLTYSRVARTALRLEPVSLNSLIAGLTKPFLEFPSPPELRIEPLLNVIGHKASLTQAISNMLNNAIKFVPPGVVPNVHVWTEKRGSEVRLSVEDNGIGVPPKFQHRLFSMFERVHPQLQYEGNGVGLAIVRKAITRMHGTVGMESDGVQGSKFWVQLPGAG
jgi:PAS domain S-box-containing protein